MSVGFVLLAELLIFIPSLASFRQDGLESRARAAGLLAEALMDRPNPDASEMLSQQFMMQTDAVFVAAFQDGSTQLILGEPPATELITAVEDLRTPRRFPNFFATAMEFFGGADGSYLRIIAPSPVESQDRLEIILPCSALGEDMRAYARRILVLSLLIAAFVGGLIYLAMLRLIVRPIQRLAAEMTAFREAPERTRRRGPPSERRDEIGQLEREFAEMKQSLRSAFRQRERLASLGLSVTKINHDLRNVLSTALLMADRLSLHEDPQLAEMGARLTRTVERGVGLTEEVLEYSSAREAEPELEVVGLSPLVHEFAMDLKTAFPSVLFENSVPPHISLIADPDQVQRILSNLCRNAAQAMAGQPDARITLSAETVGETAIISISDNGPGLPEAIEDRLFLPFTRGDAPGSTGLGLSISKELAEGMGGSLELLQTGPTGTCFILGLPLST